jgi:hypothetical protein
LDASSSSWDEDRTQDDREGDDHVLRISVEEELKRRREGRLHKREATKKNMSKLDTQYNRGTDHTACQHKDVRRERAFRWYTRLGKPTRTQFKRKVTAEKWIHVIPRDIDLLPWRLTGRVVNMKKMKAMVRASVLKP